MISRVWRGWTARENADAYQGVRGRRVRVGGSADGCAAVAAAVRCAVRALRRRWRRWLRERLVHISTHRRSSGRQPRRQAEAHVRELQIRSEAERLVQATSRKVRVLSGQRESERTSLRRVSRGRQHELASDVRTTPVREHEEVIQNADRSERDGGERRIQLCESDDSRGGAVELVVTPVFRQDPRRQQEHRLAPRLPQREERASGSGIRSGAIELPIRIEERCDPIDVGRSCFVNEELPVGGRHTVNRGPARDGRFEMWKLGRRSAHGRSVTRSTHAGRDMTTRHVRKWS